MSKLTRTVLVAVAVAVVAVAGAAGVDASEARSQSVFRLKAVPTPGSMSQRMIAAAPISIRSGSLE